MLNYKLTIEYDGTHYAGWQKQKNATGIQEVLEKHLSRIFESPVKIQGASRTDAGVHARCQVAHLRVTRSRITPKNLQRGLNAMLPKDIVVLKAEKVPRDFHARFHAKRKIYTYTILNRKYSDALRRRYIYFYPYHKLNLILMRKAAQLLKGKHDFASFSKDGSKRENTVRHLTRLTITKKGDFLIITLEADGFLYNMVRIIVGTLIELSRGRITPDDIKTALESRNRSLTGFTVPPSGLFLEKIYY